MVHAKREDLQIKVPALLHLSRLGYGYLDRPSLRSRDRKTNILPDALRNAAERINGIRMTPEMLRCLTDDLRSQLDREDLGRQFYCTIRNGWNGIRLIDFAHPEKNLFQSAAELACGSGAGSFRPDITLFVNGLPLAVIEVKTRERPGGLQAEYDRMLTRIRSPEGRRYFQCVQIWAFSDDCEDDPGRFLPTEGSFYATVMADDFPVYAVRERHSGIYSRLISRNPEEEQRILADNGIPEEPHTRFFQQSRSSRKPTHRMLTTLFHPERFLFLLRYGIQYVRETDPAGKEYMTRRMLTTGQLSVLEGLIGKAKRGYRNWTALSCGAAGEEAANASMVSLLRDLEPEARLYWVSADETALHRDLAVLRSCGVQCGPRKNAADGQLILFSAEEDPIRLLTAAGEHGFSGRRFFILPQFIPKYGQKTVFPAELRKADPNAILVTRITNRASDSQPAFVLSAHTGNALYYFTITRRQVPAESRKSAHDREAAAKEGQK